MKNKTIAEAEEFALNSAREYEGKRHFYVAYAYVVKRILQDKLMNLMNSEKMKGNKNHFKFHEAKGTAKSVAKFKEKVQRKKEVDILFSNPFYGDIKNGHRITDLSRARVVTYLIDHLLLLNDSFVSDRFIVEDKIDKTNDLILHGKFGYHGIHYIVKVKNKSDLDKFLNEFKENIATKFKDDDRKLYHKIQSEDFYNIVAEIQFKTILQLAWAEVEHNSYDASKYYGVKIPNEVNRKFDALSGVLELTDWQLQELTNKLNELIKANVDGKSN